VVEQLGHASRRVLAVARVHQRLYSSKNVEVLEFAPYLRALCADLGTSLAIDGRQVKVHADAVERDIAADVAIPLGLIVSEAVTNAAKHAYGESEAGVINVAFRTLPDGRWQLVISDHGVGMETAPGTKRPRGFGMQLIQALSEQIDAALEVRGSGGTRVTVTGPAATPGAAGAAGAR
jgi:two-component sensor histidine kinase